MFLSCYFYRLKNVSSFSIINTRDLFILKSDARVHGYRFRFQNTCKEVFKSYFTSVQNVFDTRLVVDFLNLLLVLHAKQRADFIFDLRVKLL